jgi:secondary thiamine-phosphate synthase enzyme
MRANKTAGKNQAEPDDGAWDEAMHHQESLQVDTTGRGLYEVSAELQAAVRRSGVGLGLAVVYCRHTSASLVIQENADPSAGRDLVAWLERIAPDGDPLYEHSAEGPDDMPSHLRAAVTNTSETIPIRDGRAVLGTWQGLFLLEHRLRPHRRELVLHISGDR